MITAEEAGLTTDQWNFVKNALTDNEFRVTAYRWNPQLAIVTAGPNDSPAFDVVIHDGTIYRLSTTGMQYLDGDTWTAVAGYAPPSGALASIPPTLIDNEDGFTVFILTSTGISMRTYDGSWSAWSEIITDSTISFMAATAWDTVHYIVYDAANRRFNFKVLVHDGSWTVTASHIHWGFQITSMSAIRVNGKDVIAYTTELPGLITVKTVNTTVVKTYMPSGGICTLVYKYGSWSDHFNVDYVDQWTTWRYRLCVRMTLQGDTICLTAYSSDGTKLTPITGYRTYASKDGKHWSRGELIPLPVVSNRGVLILVVGDLLYAFTCSDFYRAPATLRFSATPNTSTAMNISPWINTLSISRQDMQQVTITIDNVDNRVMGTFMDGSVVAALRVETGFWDDEHAAHVFVQIGLFEIDTIEPSKEVPGNMLDISARDRMAWMTTKTQSETFRYWQPQINAGDEYIDITATGYGGMTHTGPILGSFKAADGALQLISNNELGLSESTFLDDTAWNCAAQVWGSPATLGNDEYFGIQFWGVDKDNFVAFMFRQSDDKLRLFRRTAGTDTPFWVSASKSWASSLNGRFLRVEVYYCRIRMYSNSAPNGGPLVWSLEQEVILPGQAAYDGRFTPDGLLVDVSAPSPQSGYMGMIGKGYSPADVYSPAPDPIEAPFLPEGYELLIPPAIISPYRYWAARGSSGSDHSGVVAIYQAGAWSLQGSAFNNLPAHVGTSYVRGFTNPWDRDEKFVMFDQGIWKGRPWDTAPVQWEQVRNSAWGGGFDVGTSNFLDFCVNSAVKGYMVAAGNSITGFGHDDVGGLLVISHDFGDTWRTAIIFEAQHYVLTPPKLYMSGWDSTTFIVYQYTGLGTTQIIKSDNAGDTWGFAYFNDFDFTVAPGFITNLAIPYRRLDGSPNYIGSEMYAIGVIDGLGQSLSISDDQGRTWTFRSALPHPFEDVNNGNLYVHPSSALFLCYAWSDTFVVSVDGGLTWTDYDMANSKSMNFVNGFAYDTGILVGVGTTPSTRDVVSYDNGVETSLIDGIIGVLGFIEPELS